MSSNVYVGHSLLDTFRETNTKYEVKQLSMPIGYDIIADSQVVLSAIKNEQWNGLIIEAQSFPGYDVYHTIGRHLFLEKIRFGVTFTPMTSSQTGLVTEGKPESGLNIVMGDCLSGPWSLRILLVWDKKYDGSDFVDGPHDAIHDFFNGMSFGAHGDYLMHHERSPGTENRFMVLFDKICDANESFSVTDPGLVYFRHECVVNRRIFVSPFVEGENTHYRYNEGPRLFCFFQKRTKHFHIADATIPAYCVYGGQMTYYYRDY